MILPAVPVLAFKFLFWALALTVFLRYLSAAWKPTAASARRYGAAMLLGVVIGAKLVYAVTYPGIGISAVLGDARAMLILAGAGSAPGALLGVMLAAYLTRHRALLSARTVPAEPLFDLDWLVLPIAWGLAIMDIGSMFWALSEPGFGIATSMPWAMDFGDGVPRHPVMLYEAAFLFGAAWMHGRMADPGLRPGERALLFVAAYCGVRVLLGFVRPPFGVPFITEMMHPYPWIYLHILTGEQWVCMLTLVALLPAWYGLTRRLLASSR